jgi:ubiquitin carboxyl-terminal hydrolase 36/42
MDINYDNGLIGLSNLGNTCYMNSGLGCLKYTMPLTDYLLDNNIKTNNKLVNAYIDLLKESWDSNHSLSPRHFKNELGRSNKMFNNSLQHDSTEFIIHLLDVMHETLKKNNKSIVSYLFFGKFKSVIKCPNCKHESVKYDVFNHLPVSLNSNLNTLNECLDEFSISEQLDENNKYKCDKCSNYVCATKKIEIDVLPNILMIVLKRFNKQNKINKKINIPEKLHINNETFKLYSTTNHYGGKNGGHYTCNVLHRTHGWHCLNDSKCNKINDNITNDSYILFYYKIL